MDIKNFFPVTFPLKMTIYCSLYLLLVPHIASHIKDTTHFLNLIFKIPTPLPPGTTLVTIDVKSLYTNIPHDEGIRAPLEALSHHTDNPLLSPLISFLDTTIHITADRRLQSSLYTKPTCTTHPTTQQPAKLEQSTAKPYGTDGSSQTTQNLTNNCEALTKYYWLGVTNSPPYRKHSDEHSLTASKNSSNRNTKTKF